MTPEFFSAVLDGDRIVVHGELDADTSPKLEQVLRRHPDVCLVDMADVGFIDSSGIRELVHARHRNKHFQVVASSNIVRRLLEITGTEFLLHDGQESS